MQEPTDDEFINRECFIVDAILEFDSIRKRMSVMVRYPDGTYYVLSKGAETSMLDPERCNARSGYQRTRAIHYVNQYALSGLRTLVFAKRQLNQDVYMKLVNNFKSASGLIGNERIHALKKCYYEIESDMEPIGVTGIEDKLQPGVKNCIKALKEAGIQIWILTGDKAETAITVSQSIGHLTPNMTLIRIMDCQTLQLTAYKIYEQLNGLQIIHNDQYYSKTKQHETTNTTTTTTATTNNVQHSIWTKNLTLPRIKSINYDGDSLSQLSTSKSSVNELNQCEPDNIYYYSKNELISDTKSKRRYIRRKHRKYPGMANEPIGLIIDGKSLQYALHNSIRNAFLELCMSVTTVLCCRVTPLQKASIVKLVQIGLAKYTRQGTTPVIAAIGDGGNDVAMILQANIGVGVYGKEGREAVRASDYSVTQFQHIQRLFLLHGHWSYYRITITMLFFYHKAVAFVSNQICVTCFAGFSEIPSFGTILFICYNLTMTFLVSLGYGMFERHLREHDLLTKPYLYKAISHQANLKAWYILLWVSDGIWHGLVTFFIPYFCLAGGQFYAEAMFYEVNKNSRATYDFKMIGNASFVFLWIAVTIRSTIWTRDFNLMLIMCHIGTMLNVVILFIFQTFVTTTSNEYQIYSQLCRSPEFWFAFPLTVFIANIPALLWRLTSDTWWTVRMLMKNLPKYERRQFYSNNPSIWLKAFVFGQTQMVESTMRPEKKTTGNTFHEQINHGFQP
ncbi:unnamed protein product [Schistosoma turkestanicum]|nr:unnamed protein product [Schistosoma turkestanicum]